MGIGVSRIFTKTMNSGVTLSSAYTMNRAFAAVYLEIPTMVSGSDFFIQVSSDGTTFRRCMHPVINTSSVQVNTFVIGSASTNRAVPVPNGWPYMKVEMSTAMTDTVTVFNLVCSGD